MPINLYYGDEMNRFLQFSCAVRGLSPRAAKRVRRAGFTLLELLVVLVIMGLLAAVLTPQVMSMMSGAKSDVAALQIETLTTALNYYHIDVGSYPTQEQGLIALLQKPADVQNWRGPYIRKEKHLLDPWHRPFLYRVPGKAGPYDVYTLGADGKEGGEGENADIGSWSTK